ncbi:hypothetical protein HPP92_026136 [Vanilla planifolia]|uniref:Subtilisin-like protease n=1 Tax=Vanilla planifolia TaxID=51239 RepID=A0A835PFE7_VANPL|nr:hypothetical protein HPP92_026136 [Vanilla planifolia]
MAMSSNILISILLLLLLAVGDAASTLHTYIVHVHRPDGLLHFDEDRLENYYRSFLPQATATAGAVDSDADRLVYAYREAVVGFAAKLTEEEVRAMAVKKGFIRAYRSPNYSLLTTHTLKFIGLRPNSRLWSASNKGSGIVIGMIDSGVSPAHPSFSDHDIPPPPHRWKSSACQFANFTCNKKLVGGGDFTGIDATDGQANGTATGVAPRAHLAVYKVCNPGGCNGEDILAGIDAAIQDGVDVMSLSLGAGTVPYASDPISIGSFRALQKGIVTVCAAGNDGPFHESLSNEEPWVITVGASTIDRRLPAVVRLGDGQEFVGEALYQPSNLSSSPLPLVATLNCEDTSNKNVSGKIVLCDPSNSFVRPTFNSSRAAAVVLRNNDFQGNTQLVQYYTTPTSTVNYDDGVKIAEYATDFGSNPNATIRYAGTKLHMKPAPQVGSFSSRGPSQSSPGILKPDIIAPGVNVLAAWSTGIGPEGRRPYYNVISGTSMATPHVSVRHNDDGLHEGQHWEANHGREGSASRPLRHRRGSRRPGKAIDPGLVYNLTADNYLPFLCGLGYSDDDVMVIAGKEVNCSRVGTISQAELNYPSIVVALTNATVVTVKRTVTNVGEAPAKYKVELESPDGVDVTVQPRDLWFSELNQEKSFSVRFERRAAVGAFSEGSLKWISGKRVVRSPVLALL